MRGRLIADGTKETPPTRADWRGRDDQMKAVVVYESLWGNTAEVARAIAEGIAPEARALSTAEATNEAITGADLIVAGAPVLGFKLPTEQMRQGARTNPGGKPPRPADLSHPSMRSWLDAVPAGQGLSAAFDTQVRGPFGALNGVRPSRLRPPFPACLGASSSRGAPSNSPTRYSRR